MKRLVRDNLAFIAVGALLVAYVAICTHWRDGKLGADAWEHHRAIVALVEDLWHPGNPTYATDDTSIRFTPYSVTLALICRATGWSPYDVLSGAAVFNTLLLVSSFLEKLYNRCSAHTTPVAPAAPARHRAFLAAAQSAGAPFDAR